MGRKPIKEKNDHERGAKEDWLFKIGSDSYRKGRVNYGTWGLKTMKVTGYYSSRFFLILCIKFSS
jgi:hypothetical protein